MYYLLNAALISSGCENKFSAVAIYLCARSSCKKSIKCTRLVDLTKTVVSKYCKVATLH